MNTLRSHLPHFAIALLAAISSLSHAADPSPVVLSNSARYSLHSEEIDQDYLIDVALPQSYQSTDISYPVLYVIDGIPLFQLVASNKLLLDLGGVQETIVVGISYDGSFMDQLSLRERDLTPTNNAEWDALAHEVGLLPEHINSGGAKKFLSFINEQVKPLINQNFRIQQDNESLLGHSNGGLFGLYVLFTSPDSFENYVATSPAAAWDDEAIFSIEEQSSQNRSELNKKVFLAAGELEPDTVTYAQKLYDALTSRGYSGLEIEYQVFSDETHTSVVGAALNRGIRYLFSE